MDNITNKQKILLIISGFILFLVIIEISLRVAGFVYLSLQEYSNKISLSQKGQYRILCLGESTTAAGGDNSYPRQLEHILNQRIPVMQFSVINKGVHGTDTTSIISRLKYNLDRYKPHMVIVMMGINDTPDIFYMDFGRIKNFIANLRIYKLVRLLRVRIWKVSIFHNIYLDNQLDQNYYEEMFKKAIELDPNNEMSYIDIGWYYSDQGKYPQAEEMFKKAMELAPNNKRYLYYLELGGVLQ